MHSLSSPIRLILLAFAATAALALSACGSGSSSSSSAPAADLGADPATLVPADAPIYLEAVVRPEGSLRDSLDAALSKLLATDDPGAMIRDALDSSLSQEGLSYDADIAPWLGPRAGVFVTSFGTTAKTNYYPDYAAIVDVTDTAAALATVEKSSSGTLSDAEYGGVSYRLEESEDGFKSAFGIVDDFLVAGSEQAFKDVVDASGGDSLASNADASSALSSISGDHVFSALVNVPAVVDLAQQSGGLTSQQSSQIDAQLKQFGNGYATAFATATPDSLGLAFSAESSSEPGTAGDLLAGFPADSWFAFAAGNVGQSIQMGLDQLQTGLDQLPAGVSGNVSGQIAAATGLDLQQDLGWIGDLGGYVQGSSIFGLGGGLVIQATDENAARSALDKLAGALRDQSSLTVEPLSGGGDGFHLQLSGAPIGADVALQDGKVVVAVGAASVDDVLSPTDTLAGSDRFKAASSALGDGLQPSFYLDFLPAFALVESTGQATSDPSFQQAKPYLDHLDYLVAGSGSVDGRVTTSLVLGLRDAAASSNAPAATLIP